MPTNEKLSGVSNCYVFKSQLQEYAQKAGVHTPVYETFKEGLSHEPSFRSTVTVNNVKYDSLPGFFNRKAAEQSAAEVALSELFKASEVNQTISQPVHETGLCKNLLQEYAQKMNYAIPVYQIQKDEAPGRLPNCSCTVEIGGIRYIGASAKTKKEAEIKAARTALLSIQSSASQLSDRGFGNSQLTVIPCRKRAIETASNPGETFKAPKAKKSRFKKKMLKTKLSGEKANRSQDNPTCNLAIGLDDPHKSELVQTGSCAALSSETLVTEVTGNLEDTNIKSDSNEREMPCADVASVPVVADSSKNVQLTAVNSFHSNHVVTDIENLSTVCHDQIDLVKLTDGDDVASKVNDPTPSQVEEASKVNDPTPSQVEEASKVNDPTSSQVEEASKVNDPTPSQVEEASKVNDPIPSQVEEASKVNDPTPSQVEEASKVNDSTPSQVEEASIVMPDLDQAEEKIHANTGQAQVLEKLDGSSIVGL